MGFPWFPMGSLRFASGFPMICHSFPYRIPGFSMVCHSLPYGIPGFPMFPLWVPYGSPVASYRFAIFPMGSLRFPYGFHKDSLKLKPKYGLLWFGYAFAMSCFGVTVVLLWSYRYGFSADPYMVPYLLWALIIPIDSARGWGGDPRAG